MVVRGLRNAAAARTPPRILATASRLAHGETQPQRWLSRLPGQLTPGRPGPEQVRSFSALETIERNRQVAMAALDRAGVPYDAPEPGAMQPGTVVVTPADAAAARRTLAGPLDGGVRVRESEPDRICVYIEQAAGELRLAGPELGCLVRLDGRVPEASPRVEFAVDAVYTWVDGSDPGWRERLRSAWTATPEGTLHPLSANDSRFASRDELRYSLRSLRMYAGWLRHVFIVTDGQVPAWLRADHPSVTVVDHREIFPAGALPTFNSHAIEARLHHIPELSDHYLYLNDDVFFGRPVRPELFFTPDGSSRFFRTPSALDDEPASAKDRPVDAAAKTSRRLIAREFGEELSWKYQHVAHPQRRDVMADLEQRFGAELDRTVRSPFRNPDDVSAAASLAHGFGFVTGRAGPGELSYLYCDIAERRAPIKLTRLARHRDADMFCLNDVGDHDRVGHDPERLLREFLMAYFPLPSDLEGAG
jgi:Stealth protein CR2, conserved region 2/Stealth protein CR3, conserved region 3/Stealth protein CR4, conserved region 4/Stealth protein CR1, conserved region 1